ncbi:MAG TPA: MFS transporter [Xanthomonadaceae bacterium]|nr:MFS transporter [Xanthomonadaceae bacterium]
MTDLTSNRFSDALGRLVLVERREWAVLWLSFAYFFCVLSAWYVLRPIRDAMGIAGGTSQLPWLFLGTLLLTLVANPVFATLVARMPRARFATWSYRFFMLCLLGFFAMVQWGGADAQVWTGRVFFVWASLFNLFIVSLFWAVMADVFDSGQAKRLFGFIAAGGTLGGVMGGTITALFVEAVGVAPLLLLSLALLEIALRCMRTVSAHAGRDSEVQRKAASEAIGGGVLAGITHAARSPYLLGICAFMLLYTIGSTFLYFVQADIVSQAFENREARTAFFARIDVVVNGLTLAIQLGLTGRILGRLGIGLTLALLPVVSILGFGALAAAPVLMVFVVFQVARRTFNFALVRPARENLYVPLSREDKYKAKSLIDTFVYRAGDQIGAWTHAGLAAAGLGVAAIAASAMPLAAIWLVLALWLGRRHSRLIHNAPPSDTAAIERTPGDKR